jgi:hypothetical protein
MFLAIQKNIDFYSEFYVHFVYEFLMVLNFDEMNYNILFGVFFNVLWSADSGYM